VIACPSGISTWLPHGLRTKNPAADLLSTSAVIPEFVTIMPDFVRVSWIAGGGGVVEVVGGGGVVEVVGGGGVVEVVDCSLCLGVSADFVVCSEDLELQLIARESARIQQIIFGTDGN